MQAAIQRMHGHSRAAVAPAAIARPLHAQPSPRLSLAHGARRAAKARALVPCRAVLNPSDEGADLSQPRGPRAGFGLGSILLAAAPIPLVLPFLLPGLDGGDGGSGGEGGGDGRGDGSGGAPQEVAALADAGDDDDESEEDTEGEEEEEEAGAGEGEGEDEEEEDEEEGE